MANNILRKFSACDCCLLVKLILANLVTPSTKKTTSSPNSAFISSCVQGVSSSTSCRRAASTVVTSMPICMMISATAMGWMI